ALPICDRTGGLLCAGISRVRRASAGLHDSGDYLRADCERVALISSSSPFFFGWGWVKVHEPTSGSQMTTRASSTIKNRFYTAHPVIRFGRSVEDEKVGLNSSGPKQ